VKRLVSPAAALLSAPMFVVGVLFLAPLAIMAGQSIAVRGADGATRLAFDQYARFFSDPFYAASLGITFATALLVAAIAVVLAYPLALLYWRSSGRVRALVLALLLAPFYANIVVTVFGWMVLLAPGGLLNQLLVRWGALAAPVDLLNGYPAIVLLSVHRCLPFVVLLLDNALSGIDDEVVRSASLCGASDARVLRTIVFPLSMPGVVAGVIVAFSLTAAGFVIPRLVGGAIGSRFAPVLMYQQIAVTQNWRLGAATGVLLLLASALTIAAGSWIVRRLRAGRVLSDAFVQ
jgi:putative spermidine/putrescine transport system permease protein